MSLPEYVKDGLTKILNDRQITPVPGVSERESVAAHILLVEEIRRLSWITGVCCGQLDHGCTLTPPEPCMPCLLRPDHKGVHDKRAVLPPDDYLVDCPDCIEGYALQPVVEPDIAWLICPNCWWNASVDDFGLFTPLLVEKAGVRLEVTDD